LTGAYRNPQLVAGFEFAAATGNGFINQLYSLMAIRDAD
jgi:hypothetical protein